MILAAEASAHDAHLCAYFIRRTILEQSKRARAVVDVNGKQALGYTKDVLSLSPLLDRWRAFGWDAVEVDGHDRAALVRTIGSFDAGGSIPHQAGTFN